MNSYWAALDQLVAGARVEIDRPAGSRHPRLAEIVYPLDYGYLVGTVSGDGVGIDVWLGASGDRRVTGLVATVDLFKKDAEQKILLGCSKAEADMIKKFHSSHQQHALLLWRDT